MSLELWGGIECTVNRVHSRTFDQLVRSGHDRRLDDLERFAGLGLKTLRYPVLWERVQPRGPDEYDWHWSDERLERLRDLGIRPIVGLVHHGSGPRWTDLLDPEFPAKLARYASAFARRYPWIDAYVPVNEPLTTARFSALYGHWYPHRRDNSSFVQALLNQIEGVGLSMKAIRAINPEAELVQTEDLGKTFSSETLRYQADFENERRWITFDLLTGRVLTGHPLWDFMIESGADPRQIDRLAEHPCPPDIYGVNYYVTSERYLDECLETHPPDTHGGNLFHQYADVAAVRARPEGLAGVGSLLREMWARYRGPMAVTEAHIGCTREEQIRWFMEIWNQCHYLADNGIDCRAVTAWALLGAYDWNSLVTEERGDYEPGAFDVRMGVPKPTALARVVRTLAAGKDFISPILRTPGWWRRPERLAEQLRPVPFIPGALPGSPILVVGDGKGLGEVLRGVCQARGLACRSLSCEEVNVHDETSLLHAIGKHRPWAMIDACSYILDEAELKETSFFEWRIQDMLIEPSIYQGTQVRFLSLAEPIGFSVDERPHELKLVVSGLVREESLTFLCHALLDLLVDAEVGPRRLEVLEA